MTSHRHTLPQHCEYITMTRNYTFLQWQLEPSIHLLQGNVAYCHYYETGIYTSPLRTAACHIEPPQHLLSKTRHQIWSLQTISHPNIRVKHGSICHVKRIHCHHGMARPRVADRGDGLQIWRVTANILNKQSRTADSGWPSSLGVGRGANNPPP
jgi:hypothetical protein